MIPGTFDIHAPTTVAEALRLLSDLGDEAKLLAGGHSLLPMMKLRFAHPKHLIDLNRIKQLKGIREQGGTLYIGAMTTENELITSALLQQKCPLLPEAAKQISDPQVRNCGTLGGDIAHGDPGNDHPAVMIAVDATFVLQGPSGERLVPAEPSVRHWHGRRDNNMSKTHFGFTLYGDIVETLVEPRELLFLSLRERLR